MLTYIIALAAILALVLVTGRIVVAYQAAAGTPWQRFMLVFRNSETILWARLQVVVGAVSGALVWLADTGNTLVHDRTIDGAIHQLLKPEYIPVYIIGAGFLTEAIRRHRTIPDQATGAIVAAPPAPKN